MPEVLTGERAPARLLLAALALAALTGRPAPARADGPDQATQTVPANPPATAAPDPDAPAPQHYDPADLDHDGTVTRRERRRYNRMLRRQQGGPDDDADKDTPPDGTDAATAQAHSAAAGKSAASAAAAMKSAMTSPDAGAGLTPGSGGAMGALGKAGAGGPGGAAAGGAGNGAKASGNPADPRTPADFALAARSGYAPAFAAAGLKLGADGRTIVRADGSPATADDYARLRRGILAMPAALGRRPDFFSQVSPEHYGELKAGYRENPGLSNTVYKHVGTTEGDRDFVHTASCAQISGECNASVEKPSYKKGDYVAPDDLDRMWGALQKSLDDAADPDGAGAGPGGVLKGPRTPAAGGSGPLDENIPGGEAARTPAKESGSAAAGAAAEAPAAPATIAARRLWRATSGALGFGPEKSGADRARAMLYVGIGTAALLALVKLYTLRG